MAPPSPTRDASQSCATNICRCNIGQNKYDAIRGRSPKGTRLIAHAPSGRWNTQTFIAGLRCHELVAPFVINGAMDGAIFETYIRTQLAPTLNKGDVVIWDNLNVHKNTAAHRAIKERGTWVLFLPRYSPELNPIEKAFSKLKAWLRNGLMTTYGEPSVPSASCFRHKSAETSSKQQVVLHD